MSYTPHEWQNNEFITAEKLNHIEEGIAEGGSGALICAVNYDQSTEEYRLNKTAQEIYNAWMTGIPSYIKFNYGVPSDYVSSSYFCPIIKFSTYQYSNDIKIYASKAFTITVGSVYEAGTPALVTFVATGLNEYPVFYASPSVNPASAGNEPLFT